MDPREDGPGIAAQADLAAVESARHAAVDATRPPRWLGRLFSVTLGVAFGFALLRSPLGWSVGITVFVLGCVVFWVLDTRFKRRSGRLLNHGRGRSTVWFMAMCAVMFVIGQIRPPSEWQPWFAIAGGAVIALMGHVYIRWDEADTAKRLATGDFDSADLMP